MQKPSPETTLKQIADEAFDHPFDDRKTTEKMPAHPLVLDSETKLFRYITHDDVVRWERMERRYINLIATLRSAISHAES